MGRSGQTFQHNRCRPMIDYFNPFEYEAAKKFKYDQILDFYIEDHNYSRFIQSRRNIFLVGERGTGKTMTLLYNSFPVKKLKCQRENVPLSYEIICVYVPCNTTLTHRKEYQLLDDLQASIISEHFLVLTIMDAMAHTLSKIDNLFDNYDEAKFISSLEYVLDMKVPNSDTLFNSVKQLFQREVTNAQRVINSNRVDAFYENAMSFSSGVVPLISCLKEIPKLENTHFALMLDDGHDLNPYQIKSLNSWIAYRDNTKFSFKVATTKVNRPPRLTSSGGTILESHDFTLIDMEHFYQNTYSDFGKLSKQIVQRRLLKVGVSKDPKEFFPTNPALDRGIEECRVLAEKEARDKFVGGTQKQIIDFAYKYGRAKYFRRHPRANLPPYSGFEILVHVSTGVIRNLLEPCYWMYDKVISDMREKGLKEFKITKIPYSIQTQVILERSRRKWELIKEGFDKSIEGCSREQAAQLYNLIDNLAILFRKRLLYHKSEPRAIVFTISDTNYRYYDNLIELLKIAQKGQILYTYRSSAKDQGKRETYYVLNRILWPERGLDPVGQYARVSIKARNLWAAAERNVEIPFGQRYRKEKQLEMFL